MRQFHSLTVTCFEKETADSRRIGLQVPDELRDEYDFLPGQHLPIEITVDGKRIRRTYSICSAPGVSPLEIGVRIQDGGQFSNYVAEQLNVGDKLQVMPPIGQFHISKDSPTARYYIAFAAGSGITPILSIVRSLLETHAENRVVLFYGNRRQKSTMFINELYGLKNRYPERLQLQFLFSREAQEFPIMDGRLDAAKVRELYAAFCANRSPDDAYICGPDTMIDSVTEALVELGIDTARIHAERFGAPRRAHSETPVPQKNDGAETVAVTVIMDGHRQSFEMPADAANLVDGAAAEGIDLPYSCKGGVCATCRTHLRSGEVRMAVNYGLEPWELEKGYVLACQSTPVSAELVLDYDRS